MPEKTLKVTLLTHTPEPEKVCALAARTCYSALDMDALKQRVDDRDQNDFLRRVVGSGHHSVLEHASFTFAIEGVSRSLLAQITRHRIASFSVQSQRYVSLDTTFGYVIPPQIKALGEDAVNEFARQMDTIQSWYIGWQEKLGGSKAESANEDARFVLPNACETHITVTMNVRELLHFFSLRCCSRAQWEIRALAVEMLRLCKQVSPVLFENAGPGCVTGHCPEGEKTCGRAAEQRVFFKDL